MVESSHEVESDEVVDLQRPVRRAGFASRAALGISTARRIEAVPGTESSTAVAVTFNLGPGRPQVQRRGGSL